MSGSSVFVRRSGLTLFRATVFVGVLSLVLGLVGVAPQADAARRRNVGSRVLGRKAAPRVATPVASRPDEASAVAAARAQGSPVEVADEHTPYEVVYANPDGSFTADQWTGPQWVQQPDASWRPVDLTLRQSADGHSVVPVAGASELVLSNGEPGLGTHVVASVSAPGDAASLHADEAAFASSADASGVPVVSHVLGARVSLAVGWRGRLPMPTLTGSTATYAGVAANTDLQVSALPHGVETVVVLRTPPAAGSGYEVSLPLSLSGLTVQSDGQGGVVFVDANGAPIGFGGRAVVTDSSIDPASGESAHSVSVPVSLSVQGGRTSMSVSVPASFFATPGLVYPVRIDPTDAINTTGDTYVEKGYDNTNFGSSQYLKAGTYDGGVHVARSYLVFPLTKTPGLVHPTTVLDNASLNMWEWWAFSCTKAPAYARRLTSAFSQSSTTWNTKPSQDADTSHNASDARRNDSSGDCAQYWINGAPGISVTGIVRSWLAGTTNYGFAVTASETTNSGWKQFYSNEWTNSNARPFLRVNFHHIPGTPTNLRVNPSSGGWTDTTTPTVSATVTDLDGGNVASDVYVFDGSTQLWKGRGTSVPSGGTSSVTIPAGVLTQQDHPYTIRVFGVQNSDVSTGYAQTTIRVVPDLPAAPAVTASNYDLSGGWTDPNPATNTFTFAPGASPTVVAAYTYSLDGRLPVTVPAGSDQRASLELVVPDGLHTLAVAALNRASAAGPTTTVTVRAGRGYVSSPPDQARTQRFVRLQTTAAPTYGYVVRYEYQVGTTGGWSPVPASDLTEPGTTTHPTYPLPITGQTSALYDWDVRHTAGVDGLVQVRTCLGVTADSVSVCGGERNIQVNTSAFGGTYATAPFGPGQLSLTTGDFQLSSSDVSVAGMTVTRTLTTLSPDSSTGPLSVFGKGWVAGWTPGLGAAGQTLDDTQATRGYLTLTDQQGYQTIFARSTSAGPFVAVGEARDGSYIDTDASGKWVLHDVDGSLTTFQRKGTKQVIASVHQPGEAQTTTYTTDGQGRVTQILAPVDPSLPGASGGTACSAPITATQVGCRALEITYATSTTATGVLPTQWGSFAGQVAHIDYRAWNPTTNNVTSVTVATYLYDNSGLLREQYDPRISPRLATLYDYRSDVSGSAGTVTRLTRVTPPGLAAWSLQYDSTFRVVGVVRHDAATNTDVTSSAVYDIGIGADSPIDLTAGSATPPSAWGQTFSLPIDGTAIFPPSLVPARSSDGDYAPIAEQWPHADLTYYDDYSRPVNTAVYGAGQWLIDSTQYDSSSDPSIGGGGNITWSLTAANRAAALGVADSASNADVNELTTSAARADALATLSTYDGDGNRLTQTGPTHDASLAADPTQTVSVRTVTENKYDEAEPETGGPYNLLTTSKTYPQQTADPGAPAAPADTRITTNGYNPIDGADSAGPTSGWTLRSPTKTTIVMGVAAGGSGTDLTTSTLYDSQGRVIQVRQPSNPAGGGAGTSVTSYYSAAAGGQCGGHAAYVGLVCQTGPAVQPVGAPVPVSTVVHYDRYLQPATTVDASGSTARTTTNTYDTAGRLTHTAITHAGPNPGADVAAQTFGFDSLTGLPSTTTAAGVTVATGYDSFGRVVSQTDGSGNTATTTYTIDSQVATVTDAKSTTTYTYDSDTEHRGLVTSMDAGFVGFGSVTNASYDAAGTPRVTYPNGVLQTAGVDAVGEVVSKTYTTSDGGAVLEWSQVFTPFGQVSSADGPSSQGARSLTYGYDPAGRLTTVNDTIGTTCTTRTYGFDVNSNRTSFISTPAESGVESCPVGEQSTSTTRHTTFDGFDRAVSSTLTDPVAGTSTGTYGYDPFARVTALPNTDVSGTGSGNVAVGYFVNDLAHTQSQAGHTRTFSLDALQREASWTDSSSGGPASVTVQHFDDTSDTPAWSATTVDAVVSWSDTSIGPDGNLALTATGTGTGSTVTAVSLSLVSPHGDVSVTLPDVADVTGADLSAVNDTDEYGVALSADPPAYGWVGAKLRTTNTTTGLIQMGVRLYNPTTGRFLQTDPVPGGNPNTYTYPLDPITGYDLTGTCSGRGFLGLCKAWHFVGKHKVTLTHLAVGVGVGALVAAIAIAGCVGTAGFGCVILAGAVSGAVFGTGAQLAVSALYHEKLDAKKVALLEVKQAGLGVSNAFQQAYFGARGLTLAAKTLHLNLKLWRL